MFRLMQRFGRDLRARSARSRRPRSFNASLEAIEERVRWWAEIFEPPCVAVAAELADVGRLAAAGADFVAVVGELLAADGQGVLQLGCRVVTPFFPFLVVHGCGSPLVSNEVNTPISQCCSLG